ncbi:MAG: SMC-Scp complex subunit ScpB [Candidatus Sigynarchaeota archaeon]
MADVIDLVDAARATPAGGEISQDVLDIAKKDSEVLLQLVESCLFMRGEAIAEGDIADTLGIPVASIHDALQSLAKRYDTYAGAIRVREIDDGLWLMDLREEVSDHVDTFYIEEMPYTRSEVMTLAFIAFTQPVPRQVLSHYRGSNAGSHARKFIKAGFVKEEIIKHDDPRVKDLVERYKQDVAERLANASQLLETNDGGNKEKKPRGSWLDRAEYICYATTNRFCGYFGLPRDFESMKKELENWKEIYGLFR